MSKDIQEAIERLNRFRTIKIMYGNTFAMHLEQLNQLQEDVKTVLSYKETLEKELKEKSDFIDYIQAQKADILMRRNVVPKEVIKEKIKYINNKYMNAEAISNVNGATFNYYQGELDVLQDLLENK